MMLLSSQFLFAMSWLTPPKLVRELFLEISQDFEIFNWHTISLLTKVALGKKKNSFDLQMEYLRCFIRVLALPIV